MTKDSTKNFLKSPVLNILADESAKCFSIFSWTSNFCLKKISTIENKENITEVYSRVWQMGP